MSIDGPPGGGEAAAKEAGNRWDENIAEERAKDAEKAADAEEAEEAARKVADAAQAEERAEYAERAADAEEAKEAASKAADAAQAAQQVADRAARRAMLGASKHREPAPYSKTGFGMPGGSGPRSWWSGGGIAGKISTISAFAANVVDKIAGKFEGMFEGIQDSNWFKSFSWTNLDFLKGDKDKYKTNRDYLIDTQAPKSTKNKK